VTLFAGCVILGSSSVMFCECSRKEGRRRKRGKEEKKGGTEPYTYISSHVYYSNITCI
jgi:hypothetical protein